MSWSAPPARVKRTQDPRPGGAGDGRDVARLAAARRPAPARRKRRLPPDPAGGRDPRSIPPPWARDAAPSRAIRSALKAPPPQTTSSCAAGHGGEPRLRRFARSVRPALPGRPGPAAACAPGGAQAGLEPVRVEQVAAGAFRRRQVEVGLGEQRVEQRGHRPCRVAAQAPPASNRWPVEAAHQKSSKALAGPRVEADGRTVGVDRRQVGDAAEVEHAPSLRPPARTAPDGTPAPAARLGRRRRRRGCESQRPHRCRTARPEAPAR